MRTLWERLLDWLDDWRASLLTNRVAEALAMWHEPFSSAPPCDDCVFYAQVAVDALLSALTEEGPIREAALAFGDSERFCWNFDAALSSAATVKESKE